MLQIFSKWASLLVVGGDFNVRIERQFDLSATYLVETHPQLPPPSRGGSVAVTVTELNTCYSSYPWIMRCRPFVCLLAL